MICSHIIHAIAFQNVLFSVPPMFFFNFIPICLIGYAFLKRTNLLHVLLIVRKMGTSKSGFFYKIDTILPQLILSELNTIPFFICLLNFGVKPTGYLYCQLAFVKPFMQKPPILSCAFTDSKNIGSFFETCWSLSILVGFIWMYQKRQRDISISLPKKYLLFGVLKIIKKSLQPLVNWIFITFFILPPVCIRLG